MMNTEILHTVYENENGNIYNEIIENEFIKEFLVVEYYVTNTMIITECFFTNDLDVYNDQSIIFNVEELAQDTELKSMIENGRTIPNLNTFVKEI